MKRTLMGVFLTVLVSTVLMAGVAMAQDATKIPWNTMEGPQTTTVPPRPDLPDTYGGAVVSYIMIPPSSFLLHNSTTQQYQSDDFGRGPRWTTLGGHDMVAPVHFPGGAKVIYMELDYYDNSPTGQVYASLTECPWTSVGCSYHPLTSSCLTGYICSGAAFQSTSIGVVSANLTPDNLVVDNYNKQYIALVEPNTSDGLTKVAGLIIGYVLQVSPAPGTATFTDVPVGSLYHRYVEALYASGVTAGCGVGIYCPNTPVTRGQMAVFLSIALGLQWH